MLPFAVVVSTFCLPLASNAHSLRPFFHLYPFTGRLYASLPYIQGRERILQAATTTAERFVLSFGVLSLDLSSYRTNPPLATPSPQRRPHIQSIDNPPGRSDQDVPRLLLLLLRIHHDRRRGRLGGLRERRLSPRQDRRRAQRRPVYRCQEAGMGPFQHGLAGEG